MKPGPLFLLLGALASPVRGQESCPDGTVPASTMGSGERRCVKPGASPMGGHRAPRKPRKSVLRPKNPDDCHNFGQQLHTVRYDKVTEAEFRNKKLRLVGVATVYLHNNCDSKVNQQQRYSKRVELVVTSRWARSSDGIKEMDQDRAGKTRLATNLQGCAKFGADLRDGAWGEVFFVTNLANGYRTTHSARADGEETFVVEAWVDGSSHGGDGMTCYVSNNAARHREMRWGGG